MASFKDYIDIENASKNKMALVLITSKSKESHKQDGVFSKLVQDRKREEKERWLVFEIEKESQKQEGVFSKLVRNRKREEKERWLDFEIEKERKKHDGGPLNLRRNRKRSRERISQFEQKYFRNIAF